LSLRHKKCQIKKNNKQERSLGGHNNRAAERSMAVGHLSSILLTLAELENFGQWLECYLKNKMFVSKTRNELGLHFSQTDRQTDRQTGTHTDLLTNEYT
jgi:hypothetical protein